MSAALHDADLDQKVDRAPATPAIWGVWTGLILAIPLWAVIGFAIYSL